jgi:hypothetical protein
MSPHALHPSQATRPCASSRCAPTTCSVATTALQLPGRFPAARLTRGLCGAQGLVGLVPELGNLRQVLPAATLAWRLQLLQEGCLAMEGRYGEVRSIGCLLVGWLSGWLREWVDMLIG